jgi:subtilisin family serine protease
MQNHRSRLIVKFASLFGSLALSAQLFAAPLPLRTDGVYQFKEGNSTVTYRIVLNQAYASPTATQPGAFVPINGGTTATAAQAAAALEAAQKRKYELVIQKDGDPNLYILRKKLIVTFVGSYNVAAIAKHVGARAAVALPETKPHTFLFTFTGPADSLAGAETLSRMANVQSVLPTLANDQAVKNYVPNDTYYLYRGSQPGYCWHLKNTGQNFALPGLDINVEGAWDTIRGTGIRVSVVDDGLEVLHDDLQTNVIRNAGYDFLDLDTDPTAGEHGTACGGIIAAQGDNNIGTIGVAWRARLIGLRFLGGFVADDEVANALYWSPQLGVSNNSWGYRVGYVPADPSVLQGGINLAAKRGRGARGTVMVVSAGNSRGFQDSNDGPISSPYWSLTVGAINDTGDACSYTTRGACVLIGAPSGDILHQNITTTDRSGNDGYNPSPGNYSNRAYTNTFNGTSAAAPKVSGLAALMVNAKPSLAVRDVWDIMIRNAKRFGSAPLEWQDRVSDGKIYHLSHDVGAGLIDASASVATAKTWRNLGFDFAKVYEDTDTDDLPDGGAVTKTFRVPNSPRIRVEKVEVTLTLQHPRGAGLNVSLVSSLAPRNIISLLQNSAPAFQRPNTWTYTSTQHWAECAGGEWRLIISDPLNDGVSGTVRTAKVVFHGGSAKRPTVPPVITDRNLPNGIEYCREYAGYRIVADNCPLSYAATGLPKGLRCDYLTGLISGTPYESGTFNVVLSARNEAGTATLNKTLLVLPRIPAPSIEGGYMAVATAGEPFRLQIQHDTTVPKTFTFGGDRDPGGLQITGDTGILYGIPLVPGFYTFNVQATNYCGVDVDRIVLVVQEPGRTIAEGLDVPGQTFNLDWSDLAAASVNALTSVDTWFWGNDINSSGGDSVVSPIFSYRTKAEFYTEVNGPVRVEFDWMSNNHEDDFVNFYTAVAPAAFVRQISGVTPWQREVIDLPAGSHVLRWEYDNATAQLAGSDQARVDNLQFIYASLATATGWTGNVSSYGANNWIADNSSSVTPPSSAMSPVLGNLESSSMDIKVTGPGTLSWSWQVSSQEDQDILSVSLDGAAAASSISGTVGWTAASLVIPAGEHVVRWTYAKDGPVDGEPDTAGADAGWVDNILFTPTP